jgi:DNA-directed RNA polymerase subunit RPC12/RpoP
MKGRAQCPKCKKEIILDMPQDNVETEVVCPHCKNTFKIKVKEGDNSDAECSWEEHGEPRKTILSSIKPKSNRPKIAAILLICVFLLGISTSIFSEIYIETSLEAASSLGLKGSVRIKVIDQDNNTLDNATIIIFDQKNYTKDNGIFYQENLTLGLTQIEVYKKNYSSNIQEIIITPFFDSEHTIILQKNETKTKESEFDPMGCTIILAIFSIFALLGFISCIKRQHFDIAMAGSFIGILSFGFFFIGSILSIIAFIFIIKSRDEFENGKKGKIF